MSDIETRLAALGLALPNPVAPVANYVPWRISGTLLVIAGQVCIAPDGKLAERHKGKLGGAVTPEAGAEAAKFCALNLLAQARAALGGDLMRLKACLRLGGFIAATPDFIALPQVMNGASDLMVAAMGDAGRHARTTVGVPVLPLDCAVEVEGLFEIA